MQTSWLLATQFTKHHVGQRKQQHLQLRLLNPIVSRIRTNFVESQYHVQVRKEKLLIHSQIFYKHPLKVTQLLQFYSICLLVFSANTRDQSLYNILRPDSLYHNVQGFYIPMSGNPYLFILSGVNLPPSNAHNFQITE